VHNFDRMPGTRNRTILVVDDENSIGCLIEELLEGEGYDVLHADNADKAMQVIADHRIDGFLLDVEMPGKDGIVLCRKIREIETYAVAPILFVTSTTTNLEKAFAAGCDDLINKPIDALVLRARLNGHMKRAEFSKELSNTRRMLDHYVSKRTKEIAEIAARTGVLPSPVQRELVVLFSDIRGFTALSDELAPQKLFSLVSAELAQQVHLIYEYGGYVDKFGGDGLMAVFDGPERVSQSCLCALHIIEGTGRKITGDARIQQLGVGIHMGQVVIGNIGSPEHFDYSVIGSAVNLAARLCGQAKPLSIVVSEAIRNAAVHDSRLDFQSEHTVEIRGLKHPVTVYALSRGDGSNA